MAHATTVIKAGPPSGPRESRRNPVRAVSETEGPLATTRAHYTGSRNLGSVRVDMDVLPRVLMIAMNDGIYQSLAQCDFDVSFITINASAIRDQLHELFYKRGDARNLTRQRVLKCEDTLMEYQTQRHQKTFNTLMAEEFI